MVDVWWAATSLGTGRFSGVDVRSDEVVEVLVMDEVAEFSAAFAVPVDPAWSVVDGFARGQGVDAAEWDDL